MKKEVEIITLGDKDYYILNEVKRNGVTYIYLSNVEDKDDILIRKSSNDDDSLYVPLESEDEFELACLLLFFMEKNIFLLFIICNYFPIIFFFISIFTFIFVLYRCYKCI